MAQRSLKVALPGLVATPRRPLQSTPKFRTHPFFWPFQLDDGRAIGFLSKTTMIRLLRTANH